MKFSVVVPTFNRQATLRQTLAALVAQDSADYEIIIVDDGSTDSTREMIAAEFPNVRYLHQQNCGPAAARNNGIRAASGDVIAFTDDDCLPPLKWLARLADGLTRHPQVVGVGGYLEAPDDVLARSVLARYEKYIARQVYRVSDREYLGGFECPAGGTNNMAYRREVLSEVGGFDEFFRYAAGEDADLKWRICQHKYTLLYIPLKVTHLREYTWAHLRRQSFMRGKGRTQFEIRHGRRPSASILIVRLARAWLQFIPDMLTMPEKPFAFARLIEMTWSVAGQWDELKRV
jgi:glycosyltransferase involved in cell wall biosynthesis